MRVPDAFYVQDGDAFVPSELTRGPWDPGAQHAGPPAALLGRAIERLDADGGAAEADAGPGHVARVTFDILRPVPIAPLRAEARVLRPGRAVELVEATLADDRGPVIRAAAWRLRTAPVEVGPGLSSVDAAERPGRAGLLAPGHAPPPPEQGEHARFFETGADVGYHTAMDYRFVAGAFLEPGPATVWMRMRQPLVAGEEPSPLQRVLAAADSGNGVSATLDWHSHVFINVDLTVHLLRPPEGEWVCLDAITIPEPSGVGLADTALYDRRGPIGRADQTLLVRPR